MNAFEVFMNRAEVRIERALSDFAGRIIAQVGILVCRKAARIHLCLEKRADFDRRLRASDEHRMAYAVWSFRAQRLAQWGGLSS